MQTPKRRIQLLAVIFTLLFVFTIHPSYAQELDITAEMDSIMAEFNDFNGVVLIAKDGDIIFNEAYGLAVREWDIPNTVDTKFRIGSVTKQFTGMAILKLQEDGLLSVDDLICDYLDDCPDNWADITIYHLLTHTSGIYNYTNTLELPDIAASRISPEEVDDLFNERELDFEVGTDWNYSNSGYHLLGHIIVEVSNIPYARYIEQELLIPLGLENTGIDENNLVLSQRAEGYERGLFRVNRANYINMNVPYSAGAMYSTAEDLLKWNQALHNGAVISQESWDTMWERAATIDEENTYGYGLIQSPVEGLEGEVDINHGGGIFGFAASNQHFVNNNVDIILLTNLPTANAFQLVDAITSMVAEYVGS